MDWYIGQKIVCVRGQKALTWDPVDFEKKSFAKIAGDTKNYPWPQSGGVYTIRYIWPGHDGACCFWLEELTDDLISYHEEMFTPLTIDEKSVETIQKAT